jgi:RNA ligase
MRYAFPEDLSLGETREVIARANQRLGVKGFYEAERGDFSVFNYMFAMPGSFPEPTTGDVRLDRDYAILRECRGLTFDTDTGKVAARKFAKFFNLNEKEEVFASNVDWSRGHVVLDKLDGSMITPYRTTAGRMRWHTKMGATDVAEPVCDFVDASSLAYVAFANAMVDTGFTPIFEWCSRKQRIVVDYPEDQLVLTAIRNNLTGEYVGYWGMMDLAHQFGIPVVRALFDAEDGATPVSDIEAFRREIAGRQDVEGYILRFDDGHMLKLKVDWYVLLHKTKEQIQFEKDVWALVLNDQVDDIKPFLDDADRDAIDAFTEQFNLGISRVADRLARRVTNGRALVGEDRKRFALEVTQAPDVPQGERSLMFSVYGGADPVEVVRGALRKATSTQAKCEEARGLCDGVRWDRYRRAVALD